MNKKDASIVKSYRESYAYDLYDAYGRFSAEKARTWEYCEELCRNMMAKD